MKVYFDDISGEKTEVLYNNPEQKVAIERIIKEPVACDFHIPFCKTEIHTMHRGYDNKEYLKIILTKYDEFTYKHTENEDISFLDDFFEDYEDFEIYKDPQKSKKFKKLKKNNKYIFMGCGIKEEKKYILYSDGTLNKVNSFDKCLPAFIQEFVMDLIQSKNEDILKKILGYKPIKESMVIKDVVLDSLKALKDKLMFPPIKWSDCIGKQNRKMLMESLYTNAKGIRWNKIGITRGYAMMKVYPKLDDKSKTIFYNMIMTGQIKGIPNTSKKTGRNPLISLTSELIKENLDNRLIPPDLSEPELMQEIKDYINNTLSANEYINLRFRSYKKMCQKSLEYIRKTKYNKAPKVKIPKDSVFNPLQKILPEDFEWIKTGKRLKIEGDYMHHCVATYAQKINNDNCAIYHLNYNDTPYTIEFMAVNKRGKKNNKDKSTKDYRMAQIQSRYDRGAPQEVKAFVNSFLYRDVLNQVN